MRDPLHITSGDMAGGSLAATGIAGEVFVWHDIMYDGPRKPGWPDDETLDARASFLNRATGGGVSQASVRDTLKIQYGKLESVGDRRIVLWFDACLFDQSMLAHILCCMHIKGIAEAELLCLDAFPGIEPFNGLGQLQPSQLASVYSRRRPVAAEQFRFAAVVDEAFANQDHRLFSALSQLADAPLPWVPAAVARWLLEQPDPTTGLGRLETLALEAIRAGCEQPWDVFRHVAAADTPPHYWGDSTLWAKINALADRNPPLVRIHGPMARLPQWEGAADVKHFRITGVTNPENTGHADRPRAVR